MSDPNLLSGAEIRRRFLDYFSRKLGHKAMPSASLVPNNPTVLITPAGMLPFVPIFLGIEPPTDPPRVVSVQKCARVSGKASDLENVGRTPRHHTFFEMLGNFSFGDYFKKEAITWTWAFVTGELGLDPKHLWVSVLKTDAMFDEEAFVIWRDEVGVPEDRILFCGEKDNFWGPPGPTGPCGPCSEIHYDREPGGPSPKDNLDLLDTDRFVEIWNLVFMELFQDAEGYRIPLDKKNIDTGMGLERIAMVVQGKDNTFETDLFWDIIQAVAKKAGVKYRIKSETDIALRIVADHLRFTVFAIGDGIMPSNEGRGYILRMIIRRAVRYGRKYLGFTEPALGQFVKTVVQQYGDVYPEIKQRYDLIVQTLAEEEARFLETLDRGLRLLEELIGDLKKSDRLHVPGDEAFRLYDTYGFPLELTVDIAEEEGLTVDREGFEKAMAEQRERARKARKGESIVDDQVYSEILAEVGPTRFLGYETLSAECTVKALILDGERVDAVSGTNRAFEVILDRTPFYAESGGQVGDRGTFSREDGHHGLTVVVNDTVKVGDLFVHKCLFDNGEEIRVGETVFAQVEPDYRQLAAIHHSATHLLNAALMQVLGDQVTQAGSYVSPEGARFDFTLNRAMTTSEIQRVEYLINKWIQENIPRSLEVMDIESAKASGAVAMFGEKYGDSVRVIAYGDRSRELCGGTHVNALGEIGLVKILSESSIASGVRRIEMVAGERAYKAFKILETELAKTADMLKAPVREVPQKVEKLMETLKSQDRLIRELEGKLAAQAVDALVSEIPAETPVLVRLLGGQSMDGLKRIAEQLADRLSSHVILLGSDEGGKAGFVCAVSPDQVERGIKAGDIVKRAASLCGGGGGGKPGFAQAGGRDGSKIQDALRTVEGEILARMHELKTG